MKIAIFRNDLTVVDAKSYNSQEIGLARGLALAGCSVDIYTVGRGDNLGNQEIVNHGAIIRLCYVPYFELPVLQAPIFRSINTLLKEGRYDRVQINDEGSFAAMQIARACTKLEVPWIIYHGMYRLMSGRSRLLFEYFHQRVMRPHLIAKSKRVLAKTEAARRFLEVRGYRNVHVLPIGLDPSAFARRKDRAWREELNIGNSTRILLYIGAIERRRHPMLLLDILRRLGSNYHLILAGDGPERKKIERIAASNPALGVSSIGQVVQSELPSLYEIADTLLLPTDFEIFGMVILEALYFGIPVVASLEAGPEQVIRDNRLGSLITGFDVEEWALTVSAVLSRESKDKPKYRHRTVIEHFNWNIIARDWLSMW